jgi:hypothetical protein
MALLDPVYYQLLQPTDEVAGVALASLMDIGLVKLDALMGRGSRKDFYDLHAIAMRIPLTDLLSAAERKYPHVRDFELMAVESLTLFDNADRDVQPDLLLETPWDQVRGFFLAQVRDLSQRWLGQPNGE